MIGAGHATPDAGEDLIEVVHIGGKECLFYKALPMDLAMVRGTTVDADGNITMEKEALTLEALPWPWPPGIPVALSWSR